MNKYYIFVIFFLFVDPCASMVIGSPQEAEEGHLIPVNPYPGKKHKNYIDVLQICLDLPDPAHEPTLMLLRPSFDPEEAIVLRDRDADYEVIYTTVDRNVWYSIPENRRDRIGYKPKMRRLVSPLPKRVGPRVVALWNRVLQEVRYAKVTEFALFHMDGTMVEFWHAGRFGETKDPDSGLPLMMTELGMELITLCKSDATKREEIIKLIEKKILEIETYKPKG
jgi:hypothetical protein